MKIAIDIGHANHTGACGNGLEEHMVATAIAGLLAIRLKDAGHVVDILDFSTSTNNSDLNSTITAANSGKYDIGLSIHCDSSANPDARGAHVCYISTTGSKLAACIAQPLATLLPGRYDKTVKRTNLGVLNQTKPIWVLMECGFISNAGDAKLMRDHPELIADAIAQGVKDYTS